MPLWAVNHVTSRISAFSKRVGESSLSITITPISTTPTTAQSPTFQSQASNRPSKRLLSAELSKWSRGEWSALPPPLGQSLHLHFGERSNQQWTVSARLRLYSKSDGANLKQKNRLLHFSRLLLSENLSQLHGGFLRQVLLLGNICLRRVRRFRRKIGK